MARISEKTVKDVDGHEGGYPEIIALARLLARSAAREHFPQTYTEGEAHVDVGHTAATQEAVDEQ